MEMGLKKLFISSVNKQIKQIHIFFFNVSLSSAFKSFSKNQVINFLKNLNLTFLFLISFPVVLMAQKNHLKHVYNNDLVVTFDEVPDIMKVYGKKTAPAEKIAHLF
jgi:hypothetical protein